MGSCNNLCIVLVVLSVLFFLVQSQKLNDFQTRLDLLRNKIVEDVATLQTRMEKDEAHWAKVGGTIEALMAPRKAAPVVGMPTSCRDLKDVGHISNGLYLVQGVASFQGKIEVIYCDFFQDPPSEIRLGYPDIKTKPAYFYMQVGGAKKVILNEGGALNSGTGDFTAPADGIYHFTFSGVKSASGSSVTINLEVNGQQQSGPVGSALAGMANNEVTLSLHSTIKLSANDTVKLSTTSGLKSDGDYNCWSGWILEEDVLVSVPTKSTIPTPSPNPVNRRNFRGKSDCI